MLVMNALAVGIALLLAQPAPPASITLDPSSPLATDVHWTVTLSAPYCGGFRIGDGVYLQPEAPLALPTDVPSGAVLFDGQPADVALQGDVLRVAPSLALAQPQFCQAGSRPFTIELLGALGLTNPGAGDYAVDVWLGSGGATLKLPVTIDDTTASDVLSTTCDPLQQKVNAATATLDTSNAALRKTFNEIRAQSAQLATDLPSLASAQADLVRQLDQVEADGQALAASGWNRGIAYAEPASEWAQGAAQTDLATLKQAAIEKNGSAPPSLGTVTSLVQLAQQQVQDSTVASQHLADVLQQFGDCGLGTPPTP